MIYKLDIDQVKLKLFMTFIQNNWAVSCPIIFKFKQILAEWISIERRLERIIEQIKEQPIGHLVVATSSLTTEITGWI